MFTLPELPYADTALAPHMSQETLALHHGAHHRAYVDKLNTLIEGSVLENRTLDAIVLSTRGSDHAEDRQIFNNAGQHWNHSFFWQCLSPGGGGAPDGALASAITKAFGGFESFKKAFHKEADSHFGSGWAWLVSDGEAVDILCTHDADTPLAKGMTAILCCDLWEHAYYLDHRNKRAEFIACFFDHLANWRFAEECFADVGQAQERFRELRVSQG